MTTTRAGKLAFAATFLVSAFLLAPRLHGGTPRDERRAAREKERAELARDVDALEGFSRAFRRAAALARPSVVHIAVRGPFQASTGTGVILDERGVILTNNHVVAGDGAELSVKLHDDRVFEARVKGRDPRSDLAVIQLVSPPDDLEAAVLGDSDQVAVGDWVIAVGNPFGLDQTVTAGIVSAKGRANVGVAEFEDFIQTDAAVNPGNSGGPLLDLKGRVIGINTAIASRTGGYQGIGFSIPIDMARDIARQLEERGVVVRGWLGVAIQDPTPEVAARLGLGARRGALVADVTPGGPAEKAGLRANDVILSVGGKAVDGVTRLRNLVARAGAGTKTALEVWREGAPRTVEVELGELPESRPSLRPARRDTGRRDEGPASSSLGITARQDEKGVVIADVDAGSLAAMGGVEAGSFIRELDGKPIRTIEDLDAALASVNVKKGVSLRLEDRDGAQRFVMLRRG